MDTGLATFLAGSIAAAVAAGTFAASQILQRVDSRRALRLTAFGDVLAALDEVPAHVASRTIVRWFAAPPDFEIMKCVTRLVAHVPRRHSVVWDYLMARTAELTNADPDHRVVYAAEMQSIVLAYLRAPRRTVRSLPRIIEAKGIELLG